MSLAKVNRVAKARKAQGKCETCQTPIEPGMPYIWFTKGYMNTYKHVRCIQHYPSISERESSMKAVVYAAQENFEANVQNLDYVLDDLDIIRNAYEEYVEDVRSYAEDRRAALDEWEYGNSQLEELAEAAEEALAEVEDWEPEDFYGDEDDEDEVRAHIEEQVQEALDKVQGVSI